MGCLDSRIQHEVVFFRVWHYFVLGAAVIGFFIYLTALQLIFRYNFDSVRLRRINGPRFPLALILWRGNGLVLE